MYSAVCGYASAALGEVVWATARNVGLGGRASAAADRNRSRTIRYRVPRCVLCQSAGAMNRPVGMIAMHLRSPGRLIGVVQFQGGVVDVEFDMQDGRQFRAH